VAEWLGRALQKLLQQFESARDLKKFQAAARRCKECSYKTSRRIVVPLRDLLMKYSTWIGIIAALALTAASFIPWAYYPDINKNFTGFFSEANVYGRPGKTLIFFSIAAILFFLIPKIWAKRVNVLICALALAYCIKSYVLFTTCYSGICPEKKAGIFLILVASALMMISALLPDLKLKEKNNNDQL
jgi:hypothetical protein